jgi:hypothetical protein
VGQGEGPGREELEAGFWEQESDLWDIVELRAPEEAAVTSRERLERRRFRVDAEHVLGAVAVEVTCRLALAERPPGGRRRTADRLDVFLDGGPDIGESVAVEVGGTGPRDRFDQVRRLSGPERECLKLVRFPVSAVFD